MAIMVLNREPIITNGYMESRHVVSLLMRVEPDSRIAKVIGFFSLFSSMWYSCLESLHKGYWWFSG